MHLRRLQEISELVWTVWTGREELGGGGNRGNSLISPLREVIRGLSSGFSLPLLGVVSSSDNPDKKDHLVLVETAR